MEQKKKNKAISIGIVSALVFLILIVYFFFNSNSHLNGISAAEDALNKTKAEIFAKSQAYVSLFLKAPSSAKFPAISDPGVLITSLGNGVWKVSAWVDAQNSFGVFIRNWYSCTVMKRVGEEDWELMELFINGEEYY